MSKFLLVGADPVKASSLHPGGVLTLSIGLLDYARRNGHEVEIVNTARSGFVREPFPRTFGSGLRRVGEVFGHLRTGQFSGAFIFAGSGFSFYERVLMSLVCRFCGVNDVFVIVDGRFFSIRAAGWPRRTLARWLLRIPHRLAATGQNWDDLYAELGVPAGRRTRVHYWLAADFPVATAPKPKPEGRSLRMLFVGWMTESKGVPELLAAISTLSKSHDFSFTFVGGGTLLEMVRAAIRENGWESWVHAPGWISAEDLQAALNAADVFVLPSHAEGFPMSLIEAFSSAVPAIVTDVGGVSDSLRDGVNGFLIEPRSVDSLVNAMRRYLENPALVPEHSRAALAAALQNHDADTNCGILFDAVRR